MLSKEKIEDVLLNAGLAVELQRPVPTDVALSDLGLDSLDTYNVFVELERITGVSVADDDFEQLRTIDNIEAYFRSKSA